MLRLPDFCRVACAPPWSASVAPKHALLSHQESRQKMAKGPFNLSVIDLKNKYILNCGFSLTVAALGLGVAHILLTIARMQSNDLGTSRIISLSSQGLAWYGHAAKVWAQSELLWAHAQGTHCLRSLSPFVTEVCCHKNDTAELSQSRYKAWWCWLTSQYIATICHTCLFLLAKTSQLLGKVKHPPSQLKEDEGAEPNASLPRKQECHVQISCKRRPNFGNWQTTKNIQKSVCRFRSL